MSEYNLNWSKQGHIDIYYESARDRTQSAAGRKRTAPTSPPPTPPLQYPPGPSVPLGQQAADRPAAGRFRLVTSRGVSPTRPLASTLTVPGATTRRRHGGAALASLLSVTPSHHVPSSHLSWSPPLPGDRRHVAAHSPRLTVARLAVRKAATQTLICMSTYLNLSILNGVNRSILGRLYASAVFITTVREQDPRPDPISPQGRRRANATGGKMGFEQAERRHAVLCLYQLG